MNGNNAEATAKRKLVKGENSSVTLKKIKPVMAKSTIQRQVRQARLSY